MSDMGRVGNRIEIEQTIRPSERRTVHVSNEPNEDRHSRQSIEPNAFNSMADVNNDQQQRTTMDLHFDRLQQQDPSVVHVLNEPDEVGRKPPLHSGTNQMATPQQIRNRIANQRRRAKRYRFEVIRQIDPSFNITKIKRVLKAMDIRYVNINIVRQTLFIGLKDQTIVEETERLLHDRLFTEQHHRRLYPKNEMETPP